MRCIKSKKQAEKKSGHYSAISRSCRLRSELWDILILCLAQAPQELARPGPAAFSSRLRLASAEFVVARGFRPEFAGSVLYLNDGLFPAQLPRASAGRAFFPLRDGIIENCECRGNNYRDQQDYY